MRYSVITINYNNKEGLKHTIESVVCQTCTDFEFIIIDGGSTDGSVEIIREYEEYITYWVSEEDHGIYHAMNKGVAQSHGEYCIFMNSGDCFYSQDILHNISLIGINYDIVIGNVVSKDGIIISQLPNREISLYHLYSGAIPHQGAFIKSKLLKETPYDESLKITADWKFFLFKIIKDNCSVNFINDIIAVYDTNGISTTNQTLMKEEKERVLKEFFPNRLLLDYQYFKESECMTQLLTPQLRKHYRIDRLIYNIAQILLRLIK